MTADSDVLALLDRLESSVAAAARMESLLLRFLSPEDLGLAVTPYVRDEAREALGKPRVEHAKYD